MTTGEVAIVVSCFAALVGLYGAVNAHRALVWQRRRDEERSRVQLRVDVEHSVGPGGYAIIVTVVNVGESVDAHVSDVSLRSGGLVRYLSEPDEADVRLEPHTRLVRTIVIDKPLAVVLRDTLFAARATLASGATFDSQPQELDDTGVAIVLDEAV
jgi:hypothetical protein